MNTMMLLEMAAQAFPDEVAFVNGDDTLTYGELFAAAGSGAKALRESDAEHLAMLDVSSFALPIGLFAAAWAGKPFVPINYRLSEGEIDALLERIAPAQLVTSSDKAAGTLPEGISAVTTEDFISASRTGAAELANDWPMEADDTAILLFTSGTTGAPKAAVLRHRNVASYVLSSIDFASGFGQTAIVTVPPYHIAGVISVLGSVYATRKVVQLANFNARAWIDLARSQGVTTAFLVPTMLRQIIAELEAQGEDAGMDQLSAVAYGGGKMPQPVIEKALKMFPDAGFTQAYGLTETSSTIALLLPADHAAALASDDPKVRRRLTSVGRMIPGVEVEIRDAGGNALAVGEAGEIWVRGEQIAGEYVGKGSMLDADGWFPTRDAGELDEEGYLFLEGRSDDVIVRGAENMSPGEIEDVLHEHIAVADVGVVGVPDEHWGEAVAAVIVLKEGAEATAEELQGWVKQHLRSSKVPSVVRFVEELPYNDTGKLLRRVLRQDLASE